MAKIKKLKENGSTIYPATIPQAVIDPKNKTKLSEIIDDLALTFGDMGESKNVIQSMSDLRSTIGEHSESGLDGYVQYLNLFIDKVNTFLEDAGVTQGVINSWKEIENFLQGITDTETLTGLLAENLQSAKSYADTKVSSGTANMVTMSANAGAADRVLTSAGRIGRLRIRGWLSATWRKKTSRMLPQIPFMGKGLRQDLFHLT